MITLTEAIREVEKEEYLYVMYLRNRILITLDENNFLVAMVTFCITDKPTELVRDQPWSIPNDNPDGKFLCFDRCVSQLLDKKFSVTVTRDFIRKVHNLHPTKKIMWFSRRNENAVLC